VTKPQFITNDAEIRQLEGLYIKERNPPASVSEAALNTVGVFGRCLKGPVGTAVTIGDEARFVEVFGGGYLDDVLVNDVWKSLLNKNTVKDLRVVRVAAAAAVAASFTLETAAGGAGTALLRIDASSVGAWGNELQWKVTDATDANVNHFNLTIQDTLTGKTVLFENLDISTGNDNTATVVGTDDGRLITLTKLASGRPVNSAAGVDGADSSGYTYLGQTVAGFTSVVGADGTLAASDYYGTGKGLDVLADLDGVGIVYCAEYSSATLKSQVKTKAATATDRMFIIEPDSSSVDEAAAITDVATYRNDDGRIIYVYGHAYTVDPVTATEILTSPAAWMATVLGNTDVDIHPGEQDTKRFLAGISRLYRPSISRANYKLFKAAGISSLETDAGDPVFVSGITTSLVSGKTEITRRRSTDFLQLSVADYLKYHVKKKNTVERRIAMRAAVSAFLNGLKRQGRVVEEFEVDGEILNTAADRANGIERLLMRVKLIGHMLHVVLETEVGTGVTISAS
jgi:hypothetical protein